MKKTNITIDPIKNVITVSKAYYKRACSYGSHEYFQFRAILSENAGCTVEFAEVEKKTYSGLTFKVMEAYILTQPNSEKQLKVFEAVKRIAEAKNSKYPLTKKWFLNAYPNYKENEVKVDEIQIVDTEVEAQAAAELALVG